MLMSIPTRTLALLSAQEYEPRGAVDALVD
jgi:hypothetical protein